MKFADFPSLESDIELPPEPDVFVLPPVSPPLVLKIEGAEYRIPVEQLSRYLRFTAEQLEAVDAMRAAGVDESVIAQAFPPKIVAPEPAQQVYRDDPQSAAPVPSPPGAPPGANHLERAQRHCPIGHNKTMMDDYGRVVCIRCGFILLGKTGFVDNRNPGWNGMSRVGAINHGAGVRVLAPGEGEKGFQDFRGDAKHVG